MRASHDVVYSFKIYADTSIVESYLFSNDLGVIPDSISVSIDTLFKVHYSNKV